MAYSKEEKKTHHFISEAQTEQNIKLAACTVIYNNKK